MVPSLNTDTSNQNNELYVETQYESYATLSELSNYSDLVVIASPTDDFENNQLQQAHGNATAHDVAFNGLDRQFQTRSRA